MTAILSRRYEQLSHELELREREALRVYRPSPYQEPFHKCTAPERLVRGGKRSGKSVCVAMEFGSIVSGLPLYDSQGNELPRKYPVSTPDNPLIYWIIGWDTKHIGQTIHKLLFQRGMGGTLRILRDGKTKKWRVWNRGNHGDLIRQKDSELAEPIIPSRLIDEDSWDWEYKAANQFNRVTLLNGARIFAYPSSARNPKQGDAVAGIWIDEDIQYPMHLKEWQDRLTDLEGWMMWSIWPHSKNSAFMDLEDRAISQAGEDEPQIRSFQLIMSQNPYLTERGKKQSLNRMETEEEIARRDRGELLLDLLSMYDYYPSTHLLTRAAPGELPENLQKPRDLLRSIWTREGRLPNSWTRYLSIDPSHTRTAVMSCVVPPQDWEGVTLGHCAIVEWELVVRKHTAGMLATALKQKMQHRVYEAFIMDQNIGRQTRVGCDDTVFEIYAKAFRKERILSRTSGSSFIPGVNKPPERYRAVRDLLALKDDHNPTLFLCDSTTPELQREFYSYRKKQMYNSGEEIILDEPANPRKHDAIASLEYLCAYLMPMFAIDAAYVEPQMYGNQDRGSPAYRRAKQIIRKQQEAEDYVHLGPGALIPAL